MLDSSWILMRPLLQEASSHRQFCRKNALWMALLLLSAVVSFYFAMLWNPKRRSMGQNLLITLAWQNTPPARSPILPRSTGHYAKGLRIWKAVRPVRNSLRQATASGPDIVASKVGGSNENALLPSSGQVMRMSVGMCLGAVAELAALLSVTSLTGLPPYVLSPCFGTGPVTGAMLGIWTSQTLDDAAAERRREVEEEEEDYLKSLGLSKQMLATAQQCAAQLAEAEQSLELFKNQEESQRKLLEEVDRAMAAQYSAADAAMQNDDEAAARRHLEERNQLKRKREVLEAHLTAAGGRVASMQAGVASLVKQKNELEQIVSRSVKASTTWQASLDEVASYSDAQDQLELLDIDAQDERVSEQYPNSTVFRTQMLQQRLARHELQAIAMMTYFEKMLTEDPGLAAETKLTAVAPAPVPAPAAKTKSTLFTTIASNRDYDINLPCFALADWAGPAETTVQGVSMKTHADGTKVYHFDRTQ